METTPGGDEYIVLDTVTPHIPCPVSNRDVVSNCGLSELTSAIHSDDESDHDAISVQTCVDEVENADDAMPQKRPFSIRGQEPMDDGLDPRSQLREYEDSKRTCR